MTSKSIVGKDEWGCGEGATCVCGDGSVMQEGEDVKESQDCGKKGLQGLLTRKAQLGAEFAEA